MTDIYSTRAVKIQQGDVLLNKIEIGTPEYQKFLEESANPNLEESGSWHHQTKKEAWEKRQTTLQNKKVIMAYGEHTGHHHRFETQDCKGFIVENFYAYWTDEPKYLVVTKNETEKTTEKGPKMYHEEHNPVIVPPGIYRRDIVREFDHLMQDTRRVVD